MRNINESHQTYKFWLGVGIGKNFDEDLKKWIINNVPMYWQGSAAALLIQSTLIMESGKIDFKLIKNCLQQKLSQMFKPFFPLNLHPVKNLLPTNSNLVQTFNRLKASRDCLPSLVQLELMN